MKEFIVETDLDLSCVIEFTGAGDISFKPHGELIRCRDCKYYTGKWCTKFSTKQFDINDIYKSDDDFCSMAERKESKPVTVVKET